LRKNGRNGETLSFRHVFLAATALTTIQVLPIDRPGSHVAATLLEVNMTTGFADRQEKNAPSAGA